MRIVLMYLLSLWLGVSTAMAEEDTAAAQEQYYVIVMRNSMGVAPSQREQEAMVAHVAHLNKLYEAGSLYMAGPFMDRDAGGHQGICIVRATSAAEARAMAEADPSVQAGVMSITAVHQWWAAFDRANGVTFSVEQMTGMVANKAVSSSASPSTVEADPGMASGVTTAAAPEDMAPGGSNFIEFPSSDLAATEKFYGELFGWTFDPMDMGDGSGFAFFSGPGGLGGAFTTLYKPTQDGPVMYINCDGITATLERITASGGAVTMPSMELPMNMGYIGQFTDPSGNQLGLWSLAP